MDYWLRNTHSFPFLKFGLTSSKIEQISAVPTETKDPIYVCQFDLKYWTINFTL